MLLNRVNLNNFFYFTVNHKTKLKYFEKINYITIYQMFKIFNFNVEVRKILNIKVIYCK